MTGLWRALGLTVALVTGGAVLAADVVTAPGARLRWLDKLTGETADIELLPGQAAIRGRLTILLDECRYPADNPAAEAFAHLTVTADGIAEPVYSGWMVASSPALSALEHPRYDVWVLTCMVEAPKVEIDEGVDRHGLEGVVLPLLLADRGEGLAALDHDGPWGKRLANESVTQVVDEGHSRFYGNRRHLGTLVVADDDEGG